MGGWEQLRLVLFKNFLLRIRQPVILALEVLWPVTIFLIVLSVRHIIPPTAQPTCYYNARAQPSAGALPFLQSLICNIDNECLNQSAYEEIPTYGDAKVANLVDELYPLMADQRITNLVRALPRGVKLMQAFANTLDQPEIKKVLEEGIPVKDLIKNEDKVREILVTEANISSRHVADALLNSRVNIPKLIEMMGSTRKLADTVCDPSLLKQYLVSQNEKALEEASIALCKLDGSSLPNLIDRLQQEVDGRKIMKMVSELMSRFGRPDVGHILEDLGNVWDTLFSLKSIPFDTTGLNRISIWFPHLKAIYKSIKEGQIDLLLAGKVANDLEPLYENKEFGNEIKEMIKYFNTVAEWIMKGVDVITEVHSMLGSLFRDTSYIEEKMKDTLNPRVLKSLLSVPVSTRVKQQLKAKKTPKDMYILLCKDPGLTELVYQNDTESSERNNMLKFQTALCGLALNGTTIEFIDLFNLKEIAAEEVSFAEFINNTASVLNTIGILSKEWSGSSQNYIAVLPKILDAVLSFFLPSSASGTVRVIDGIGVTLELIQEIHGNEKINHAFNVIYKLLSHSMDVVNLEHETSLKYGVFPYWPYLVETFYYSFTDETKWKTILDFNNWPEIFCDATKFSSTFILKDVSLQPIQEFSCQLFSRHFKVIRELKDSASSSSIKWGGLVDKSATLLNHNKEQRYLNHYRWKRLISAYRSFSKTFWKKMNVKKRVYFSFQVLNWAGRYLEMAKVPYWQDMLAIFYSSDQTLHLINKQIKSMLVENSIKTAHLSLNLPALKTIVLKSVPVLPDAVVAIGNVVTKDFKQVLDRIENLPYRINQMPCQKGSITDIIKFKDEAKIKNLEQIACIYGPLISQEVLTDSTVSSVLTAIQNVSRGKPINFNWTEAGQHTIEFIENSKSLSHFNGTIFPDVPEFNIKRMKTSLTEVKNMFNAVKDNKSLAKLSSQLLDALLIFLENTIPSWRTTKLDIVVPFWKASPKSYHTYLSFLKYIVKTISTVTNYLANLLTNIASSKELQLLNIVNNTFIEDVFGLMNDFPDLIEITTDVITNPEFSTKIAEIVKTNMSAFCSNESVFMELRPASDDLGAIARDVHSRLCRIYYQLQGDFLSGLLSGNIFGIIPQLKEIWENSSYIEEPIQFRHIVEHIIIMGENLHKLQINKPTVMTGLEDALLNPSKWEDLGGMVMAKLQQAGSQRFTLALQHASQFLKKADRDSNHKLSKDLAIASVYLSKIDKVLQNVKESFIDDSKNLTIADVFSSVPELEEIIKWSERYLITGLEVLLYTANFDNYKLSALASDENIWERLCSNSVTAYLTPLPNVTDIQDLEKGKEILCKIDWIGISQNWQNESMNSTSEEKVDMFLSALGSVLDSIMFIALHGETSLNSPLFNATAWEVMSKRIFVKSNISSLTGLKRQLTPAIEILIKNLGRNFTVLKNVDDAITVATCVLRSVRGGMSWEKLSELYSTNERIHSIFTLVNGSVDLVRSLLSTIQEPQKLSAIAQDFIYSSNRRIKFCSVANGDWDKYFSTKQGSYSIFRALQTVICSEDSTPFNSSKSRCFSKAETITGELPLNSTTLARHVYELCEVIIDNVISSMKLPSSVSNISSVPWADIHAWKSLFNQFINQAKSKKIDINSIPMWMVVVGKGLEYIPHSQQFLKSIAEVVALYANKTKLLDNQHVMTITLQELFPGSPNFQNLLRLWLPNLPELVETLFWVSLNPKTLSFVGGFSLEKFCSGSLKEYFYNPSLNDEQWRKLTEVVCNQNYTAISEELQKELNVAKIKASEPINWKMFGEDLLTSIRLSQKLIDRKIVVQNERWNQKNTWINSLKNMTNVAQSSPVLIYLPLGHLISQIPLAYSTTCQKRDSDNLKQLLCDLSKNERVWLEANSQLSKLLFDLFNHRKVSWKEFYTLLIDITQLKPIVEMLTDGKVDLNLIESEVFTHLPLDFKSENFTWQQSLEIIPHILSQAGAAMKDEVFSQPILRSLHSLVWIMTQELMKDKTNDKNISAIEDILPNMPHTQKMVDSLIPVLPEVVTTLLWTLQVPEKFLMWIRDSRKYKISPMHLICENPATKYLYNPAFKDEDWNSLLSPLCSYNQTEIANELEDVYRNSQSAVDEVSWNKLGRDIVKLINLIAESVSLPKFIDSNWMGTIQNFTLLLHRPEIKAYLTLNWPFSRFCSSNYILNTTVLPSYKVGDNISELQQFFCEMSKEKFANDAVGSFRQLVGLVRDFNRGKNVHWQQFYGAVLDMLQVKRLLNAILGDKLFARIGEIENNLLSITNTSLPIWKDPEMWKNIINIFDNIYSMANKTEDNLQIYEKYAGVITLQLESLLKSIDTKDGDVNIEPLLAETTRLQIFVELVSRMSVNAVEVLWRILQDEEEFQLHEMSVQEWEKLFCNQQELSNHLKLPHLMLKDARRYLCSYNVPELWTDVLKKFDLGDLRSQLGELVNFGRASKMNYTSFYSRVFVLVDTLHYIIKTKDSSHFLETFSDTKMQRKGPTLLDINVNNVENIAAALASLAGKLFEVEKAIDRSNLGTDALRAIYYAHWYIVYHLNKRLHHSDGSMHLRNLIVDDTKLKDTVQHFQAQNQLMINHLLNSTVKPNKLSQLLESDLTILFCKENAEDWIEIPSVIKPAKLKETVCSGNGLEFLKELNAELKKNKVNYLKTVYYSDASSAAKWSQLMHEVQKLVESTSFLAGSPLYLRKPTPYIVNTTKIELALENYTMQYHASITNRYVKLILMLIRAVDGLTGQHLIHAVGRNFSPIMIVSMGKFVDSVLKGSIYDSLTSTDVWDRLMKEMFPLLPDVAFVKVRLAGEYFSEHLEQVKGLCRLASKEYTWLKSGSYEPIMNIYCQQPPSQWEEKLESLSRLQPFAPVYIVDHLHLLLSTNYTVRNLYHEWASPKLYSILENTILTLADKFATSPPGFYRGEQDYWLPVFESLKSLIPSLFNSMNNQACSRHHISNKRSAIATLINQLVTRLPRVEQMLCEYPESNLSTFYQEVSNRLELKTIIKMAYQLKQGKLTDLSCMSPFKPIGSAITALQQLLIDVIPPRKFSHLKDCAKNAKNGTLFNSVQKYTILIKHLSSLIQEFSNSTKEIFSSPQSAWKFIQDFFTPQMPAFARLSEIVNDVDKINKTLQQTPFNLSSEMVSDVLNSSINLNWVVRRNFSQAALEQQLCPKDNLISLLVTASTEKLENNIKQILCQNGALEFLLNEFDKTVISAKLPVLQREYFLSGKWLEKLISNTQSILNHLFDLLDTGSKLTSGLAADLFHAFARVINGNTVEKLFSSIQGLIKALEPVLQGSSVIDDLKVILKGIQGLKSLQGLKLFDIKYNVQDLFTDSNALKKLLKKDLSIDDSAVNAIMDANIDLTSLLASGSSLSAKDLFCNPKELEQLLNVDNPEISIQEISTVLCNISASKAVKASTLLLRELALSRIIGNFAKLGIDGVLQKAGLTWNEAVTAVDVIKTAPSIMPKIKGHITRLTEFLDPEFREHLLQLNISQDGIRIFGTPEALKASGKILCGKPLRTLQDEFKLLEVSRSEPQLDQREIEELPSDFCQHGYMQVMKMMGGPIVWGFFKPILRGKILFAPDNSKTRLIITQLNATFDSIAKFIDTLHAWGEGTSGLQYLRKHEDILGKMKSLLQSDAIRPLVSQVIGVDASNILEGFDIPSVRNQVNNVSGLLDLVQLVGNMSQCFELSRFVGLETEAELESYASYLSTRREFIAAIVFLNLNDGREKREAITSNFLPSHVQYKLRMDIDNVPSTRKIRDKFWRPGPRDNFLDELRYFRGFVQLQELVDDAITTIQTKNHASMTTSTYLQQFPYPCYEKDEFGHFLKATLPVIMTVAWIFLIAFLVRERVLERELHLEEIMRVMGLKPWVGWAAWFISGLIILTAINLAIVVILKFGGILPYSDFFLLLVFLMVFAITILTFCNFISVFFNTATIAALTGVIIYLLSFLPFILIITLESEIPQWGKLLSCLMVSTSFCYGCVYITRYEDQGTGMQWQQLWNSPDPKDEMSFGLSFMMMIIGSALYFILGWYISNVWPANQARKEPWYFFLLASYWKINKKEETKEFPVNYPLSLDAHKFIEEELKAPGLNEKIPGRTDCIGISLSNLHVVYNKGKSKERIAVAGLTLDLFEGHITTLLGQNGAGKTTTINILTGQYPPTSGTAFVYGKAISKEFSEIQKLLGYCPQYNTLFDKMTVREHLKFYARLKGILCGKKLEQDIDEMLHSMGLWHQQKEQACYLSGGMQRRLCVSLAFIGGSKLIILDEPTSSVDPVARRNIWDLIMKYRHGRTILLTTHHMDEADILSDRVAIIHRGKLLCSGSPLLLKSKFGCGYQLTLSRQGAENDHDSDSGRASSACSEGEGMAYDTDGLLNFVQNIIPTATLMEDHGTEVVLSLPQRSFDGSPHNFHDFFTRLDSNLNQLGFGTYGLSSTTLEEVFLTLCHLEDTKLQLSSPCSLPNPVSLPKPIITRSLSSIEKYSLSSSHPTSMTDLMISSDPWSTHNLNLGGNYQLDGARLKLQQLIALLMKRCYHTLHDWKAIVSSILLPCVFIAIAMGFALIKPAATPEPMLLLTPSIYGPGDVSFIGLHNNSNANKRLPLIENLLMTAGIGTVCMKDHPKDIQVKCKYLSDVVLSDALQKYLPSSSPQENYCSCSNNLCTVPTHDGPYPYLVTTSEDIVFNLTGLNVNSHILSTYMAFTERRYGGWTFADAGNLTEIKVWYENSGYHSVPSFLNSISNAILRTNMKSLGKDPSEYGITVYNHPLHLTSEQLGRDTIVHRAAEIGIALVFLLGFAFVPSSFIVYVVRERTQEEKRLQYVGGVGPLLYWSSALLWDMLLVIITVTLSAGIIFGFSLPVYVTRLNLPAVLLLLLLFGWATTPLMYLLEKLFQEASIAFMVLYCINIFIGLNIMVALLVLNLFSKDIAASELVSSLKCIAMAFPQYAMVGGLFELARNHIQADIFAMFGQDTYKSPFEMKLLGQYYTALALEGVIFFLINLLLEFKVFKCRVVEKHIPRRSSSIAEDSDVAEERKRVHSDTSKHDVLKLVNLTQVFRSMAGQNCAVDNLSLSVPKGECFGLLGVNGAGKTTLFRILTGQLQPTSGNAFVKNMSVSSLLSSSSQLLGYCPQADALDDLLTPEQHLSVYARLRGIPTHEIKEVISRAISKFQLQMYADRKVGTLSRGTKRKVCTAISMLGNPQIILLDEPTTGMDPVTRRLVWTNVQLAIKDQRSVILTSHSMEECDVLCSRLAIMVNGKLRCLGTPQYLKYKFGTGYTISIRVADGVSDWGAIVNFIHTNFPSAILRAHHCNMVEFSLPSKNIPLSSIFGSLEKHGSELSILDVSVSQTTLDQVFVSFARQQTDGILDDVALDGENGTVPSVYGNCFHQEVPDKQSSNIELSAFCNSSFVDDEISTLSSYSNNYTKTSTVNMYEDDEDCKATKF